MAEEVGRADVVIRANLDTLTADLERARGVVQQFTDSIGKIAPSGKNPVKPLADGFKDAGHEADLFAKTLDFVKEQLIGLGLILTIKELEHLADAWTDMRFRLNASMGSLQAADQIMAKLVQTSSRTFVSIESMVDAFNDTRTAMRELGYSTQTQIDYLDALNIALAASGARGERAERVTAALSRAIAIGSLRSYTLNTILTDGDKIAEALAKELHTTTINLREFGQQGKITSEVLIKAILGSRTELETLAAQLRPTMGNAFGELRKSVLVFVGTMDQAFGITDRNARNLMNLAMVIRGAVIPAVAGIQAVIKTLEDRFKAMGISTELLGTILNWTFVTVVGGIATIAVIAIGRLLVGFLAPAFFAVTGAIRGMTAALLLSPLGIIGTLLVAAGVAAFVFRDNIKQAIGVDVVEIFKFVGNLIINSMQAAFEDVGFIWNNFPDIIQGIATDVINIFIRMSNAINIAVAGALNAVIDQVNNVQSMLNLLGIPIGKMGKLEPHIDQELANPALSRLKANREIMNKRIQQIMGQDTIGEFASNFTAALGTANGALGAFIDSLDHLNHQLDSASKQALKGIADQVEQFIAKQELARFTIGMTEEQTKALTYAQDLLFQAINANVAITPELLNHFAALGAQMAQAEAQTTRMANAFAFAKDTTLGFFQDLKSGIQQGKSIWESFADAAVNALNKILDKLIEVAVQQAFLGLGAAGGGGGGSFGTVLGGIAKFLGFHQGGIVGQANNGLTRRLGAGDLAGAKRYHTGLLPNEMLGILQKGEAVLPTNTVQSILRGQRSRTHGMARGGPMLTYAPVYNVRGSGPEIERLRAEMIADRATFKQRAVETIREAQSRRVI